MRPLHITATLRGAIVARSTSTMLDALLMAAVATRDGLDPLPRNHRGPTDLPIPIARSDCGRIYLCTQSFADVEIHEAPVRYKNRRFPVLEAQLMGNKKLKTINIQGGPCLSYHLPMDTVHVREDLMHWWAIGVQQEVAELLNCWVGFIGHRRAVGLGKVTQWTVEECDEWGDGFPVVRHGCPMRPLPPDWDGLGPEVETAYKTLLPPYWRRAEEELCAVPSA